MFCDTVENGLGLRHDPFKQLIVPHPIGWLSTVSPEGVTNLVPFSFFDAVCDDPHYVMFVSGGHKDSVINAQETGEFVCSLATYELREQMSTSSADVDLKVDEINLAGLTARAPYRQATPRCRKPRGFGVPLSRNSFAAGQTWWRETGPYGCHRKGCRYPF